jgi:hypothetical protein
MRVLSKIALGTLAAAAAALACGWEANGLAGNGSFTYRCVGAGDPECDDHDPWRTQTYADPDVRLPAKGVARGASFELRYGGQGTVAAASTLVSGSGPRFVARRAGMLGFYVDGDREKNEIEDAIRLRVVEPLKLELWLGLTEGTVLGAAPAFGRWAGTRLPLDRSLHFRATGSDGRDVLAGSLPIVWSLEPEAVATLDVGGEKGTCVVRGVSAGTARLRATFGDLHEEILLQVGPAPVADAGGSTDGDADADADAGDPADAGDAGGDA